ncbi:MAG TPA: dTDP-4-dehydrorhamnose reductase [Anaerolineales bacterium]|nr:dTDP-4-dehydrorhamnose reductase [Anaerolineales bacterium]
MDRILLLGCTGQLGWELQRTLAPLGDVTGLDCPEIDLAQPDSIHEVIRQIQPKIIVNATAYTAVDRAESEPELAMAINGIAPGLLAEAAVSMKATLIHFSTDYVFDGCKGSPYIETDGPNPLSVYGSSKLAGEAAVNQAGGAYLILRTSWVYSVRRPSFVTKVLEWSRKQAVLRMVTDQVANPTSARMLAEVTAQLLVKGFARGNNSLNDWIKDRSGIYHLAGSGIASRLEWAQAILDLDPHAAEQVTKKIEPALTAEFPSPAQRPLYSALNCDLFEQTFGLQLPDWRMALQLALDPG